MRALAAALPIALLVVLLLGARLSAAKSAWTALAAALLLTFSVFGFISAPDTGAIRNLTGVVTEGVFIAATILWILLPALAIHELQIRSGALSVLREALESAVPDAAGKVLLIGWFFALFLEGAAGFGTPLAVAAPMLVALGLPPPSAVAAALLGHAAGVAFGAVGTPVLAQGELTTASLSEITRYTAMLLIPLVWIPAVFVLRAARAQASAGGPFPWRQGAWAVVLYCVPCALAAMWLGPELPTLAGALLGGIAFVAVARRRLAPPGRSEVPRQALLRAAAPYLLMITLILVTRLIAPVKAIAASTAFGWELYGEYSGTMMPLYHPGTLLAAALLIGAWVQRAAPSDVARALLQAAKRLAPAVIALIAMLTLSRLMLHSGMIAELAQAAVQGVGGRWPAVAPVVGALGSFVTGSATASNILFTNLQDQAAASLGLPIAVILAAQGIGAAVGNAICPHNIIAGAAAVGAGGREGEIMRRTLPVCALILLLAGLLSLLLARVHMP